MTTDLARKPNVQDMVAAFERAEIAVRRHCAALVEEERLVNVAFQIGDHRDGIKLDRPAKAFGHGVRFDEPDDVVKEMTKDAWAMLADRIGLRQWMSVTRYEQLLDDIDKYRMPSITLDTVTQFVEQHWQAREKMFEESVREVFEWLRPPRSRYRRNSEYEVPRRVVLTYVVERRCGGGLAVYDHKASQRLQALENVFNALAGRGSIAREWKSRVEIAIAESKDGRFETEMFQGSVYKNGNLHLYFKDAELLERFNLAAGGNNRLRRQSRAYKRSKRTSDGH